MVAGWTALLTSLAYFCVLFGIAHYGDVSRSHFANRHVRAAIYALGLCVFCTSWTFYGSVGLASARGWDFVPVYLGPVLVFLFGRRLIARILKLSKTQNITSVADFMATRYGKSEAVAAVTALIAIICVIPYIALQLTAISESLSVVSKSLADGRGTAFSGDKSVTALVAAVILGVFAITFGTRRVEATEHQDGLMLAISAESLFKLIAFLALGFYVTFYMVNGPADLLRHIWTDPEIGAVFLRPPDAPTWITITFLSACAVMLLPRQFHVAIVENRNENDVKSAAWLFPSYLVLINLFVVPLAVAGLVLNPGTGINRDMTMLELPLQAQSGLMALLVMLGGFSAASAMVIISSVALSVMISNDLVIPLFLRARAAKPGIQAGDMTARILVIRRTSIVVIVALGFIYARLNSQPALAAMGLMCFAAIAQVAPAFIGGLAWSRGNARGALAGMACGIAVWAYTLLLPSLAQDATSWADLLQLGPAGIGWLRPTALFGVQMPVLVHGVLFSLLANSLAYAGFSLSRQPTAIENLQASIFIHGNAAPPESRYRLWHASITWGELEELVARYLGHERTRLAFADFTRIRGGPPPKAAVADEHILRFASQALTSVIGAASARLVLSLAMQQQHLSYKAAMELADDASAAIHYNRDLLQHAIDFARQGISIFDSQMRLVFWNREFREIFDYPAESLHVGKPLDELVRLNAIRGMYGPGPVEDFVAPKRDFTINTIEPFRLLFPEKGNVIELRASRMPDGGLVVTYTDVSEQAEAEDAMASINETLERRVDERTEELRSLNAELERAKAAADEANLSKTRFLAAASHDILQPLNAARLFATALSERMPPDTALDPAQADEARGLARNVDASLEAVEEILTTLLDMSRLDAGAMKPEITPFRIDDILNQLRVEFEPLAKEKNLRLTFARCSLAIKSDRRLLRRLLQNLISNAIKYTSSGRVLVGCRRRRGRMLIEVWDTGMGIPDNKRKAVFREFERLDPGARAAQGLGLGLSIVERLARVLHVKIHLRSVPGKGSVFSVEAPIAPSIPAALLAAQGGGGRPRHQPLAGMAVVAIDNEPRILEGMNVLLTGWGCKVYGADSLQAAEVMLAEAGAVPAAIIADYHLGEMSGIEAIFALRGKFGAGLPAILLTADRSQGVRLEAQAKDINLLNKPLKPAALRSLLAQWMVTRLAAE